MRYLGVFCFVALVNMGSAKTANRELEGYPVGYLSDCPGSEREAKISPKSLHRLKFLTMQDDGFFSLFFNKTGYDYYQMKALAKRLDFKKKTVLKVVGYLDSNYMTVVGSFMGLLYKRLGYNVLLLEYQDFNAMMYPKAARYLRPVGKHAAEMFAELTKYGLDPKKVEFLGISHGAHAVSFIAKNYREITGMNISRITGLDPSGPCFRHNKPEGRIDASDADFVEIIHTNNEGFGMAAAVGHFDVYVNGGEFQPGDFLALPCSTLCSHIRSYTLWVGALLRPELFIAMQCDSIQDARDRNCFDRKPFVTNVVGLNVDKTKHGIFFLMTTYTFPYAMGVKGLKRKYDIYETFMKTVSGTDDDSM